jgi:hypothetical protein
MRAHTALRAANLSSERDGPSFRPQCSQRRSSATVMRAVYACPLLAIRRVIGGCCSHEASGPSLRRFKNSNASSLQDHPASLDPLPVTRLIDLWLRYPVATVEVSPLDATVRQEVEAIRDALLNPAGARKLGVLGGADQRNAVIGIVLTRGRERRAARQDGGDEQNR